MLCFIKMCFLLLSVNITATYDVLVVFPEPTKSHGILGDAYVRALITDGHNVTYITPFPKADTVTLTHISVESNLKKSKEIYDKLKHEYGSGHKFLLMLGHRFARMSIEHPNVQMLLSRDGKFDVVIAEWIDSEIYSGFAAVFDCPLMWAVSTHLHWQPLRLMDDYPNPSYSADLNSGHVIPFNFGTRMTELWLQFMKTWILHFTINPMEEEIYERFFKTPSNRSIECYNEVSKRYSLMFVNSHPTIGTAIRVPPSVKYIGGYHMTYPAPVAPVTPDLEHIMAKHVIYFSFGTTEHTKDMSKDMKSKLLNIFGELSQNVIWKIDEDDRFDKVPSNVFLRKWVPQTSLLAHKNMKLFISHGGLLSVMEAISSGVPMVVIPRNGDQFTNAELSFKHGIAVKVEYSENLGDDLSKAMETVLKSHKYKDKARMLSAVFMSRPIEPSEEIKFWVKYVINNGGRQLRSVALDVPLYQKLYIDLASIIFGIALFVTISTVCCRWCCK